MGRRLAVLYPDNQSVHCPVICLYTVLRPVCTQQSHWLLDRCRLRGIRRCRWGGCHHSQSVGTLLFLLTLFVVLAWLVAESTRVPPGTMATTKLMTNLFFTLSPLFFPSSGVPGLLFCAPPRG